MIWVLYLVPLKDIEMSSFMVCLMGYLEDVISHGLLPLLFLVFKNGIEDGPGPSERSINDKLDYSLD